MQITQLKMTIKKKNRFFGPIKKRFELIHFV